MYFISGYTLFPLKKKQEFDVFLTFSNFGKSLPDSVLIHLNCFSVVDRLLALHRSEFAENKNLTLKCP